VIASVQALPTLPRRESATAIARKIKGAVSSPLEPGVERAVSGLYLLRKGSDALFLLAVDGPLAVESPGAWFAGVPGQVTLASRPGGGTYLRADMREEVVLLGFDWLGATEPVVPAACGAVIRIAGRLDNIYAGWVFEGSVEDPITFVFAQEGLTYVGGKGRIVTPSEKEYLFPAAVSSLRTVEGNPANLERAVAPIVARLETAPRVMTIDSGESLLWVRDAETGEGSALAALDLAHTQTRSGEVFVRVASGAAALKTADREPEVLIDEHDTWIAASSLECDDAWGRYWDASGKRSWYRRRTDEEILVRRFLKDKRWAFVREYSKESWTRAEPSAKKSAFREEIQIKLVNQFAAPGYSVGYSGSLMTTHSGQLLPPVAPLIHRGLSHPDIAAWLKKGGADADPQTIEEVKRLRQLVKDKEESLTLTDLRLGLNACPRFRRLLANRQKNYVQTLAEAVDERAGDILFSEGLPMGNNPGDWQPFQIVDSTYTVGLSSRTPYPLGPNLEIWGGSIEVVPDADGRPSKWVADGTHFRLLMMQRPVGVRYWAGPLLFSLEGVYADGRRKHVGILQRMEQYRTSPVRTIIAEGLYADGYPKHVATLRRIGKYPAGPILAEDLTLHMDLDVDAVPTSQRLMFSRFGETLVVPGGQDPSGDAPVASESIGATRPSARGPTSHP